MKTKNEKALMHDVMKVMTAYNARVFRNHVGLAFQGKALRIVRDCAVKAQPGDVLVYQARTVKAGLITGASDLIGWRTVTVTPDMVGKRVALFVACEVKTEKCVTSEEQAQFIDQVFKAGGIGMIARASDTAFLERLEMLSKGRKS